MKYNFLVDEIADACKASWQQSVNCLILSLAELNS